MESYIGLVEVGVGLVPGAGGLTYIARRAAENAETSTGKDLLPFLTEGFTAAAMAKVGTSALESRKLGYLLDSDVIVAHKDELLFVALNEAKALFQGGYRAPHKRQFAVAGRSGAATIKGSLVNMRDGGFISAHDFHIAGLIAEAHDRHQRPDAEHQDDAEQWRYDDTQHLAQPRYAFPSSPWRCAAARIHAFELRAGERGHRLLGRGENQAADQHGRSAPPPARPHPVGAGGHGHARQADAAPARGCHLVADAFAGDLAFELRERQQDVQRQSAHAGGRVELLGDGHEGHATRIEQVDHLGEIR